MRSTSGGSSSITLRSPQGSHSIKWQRLSVKVADGAFGKVNGFYLTSTQSPEVRGRRVPVRVRHGGRTPVVAVAVRGGHQGRVVRHEAGGVAVGVDLVRGDAAVAGRRGQGHPAVVVVEVVGGHGAVEGLLVVFEAGGGWGRWGLPLTEASVGVAELGDEDQDAYEDDGDDDGDDDGRGDVGVHRVALDRGGEADELGEADGTDRVIGVALVEAFVLLGEVADGEDLVLVGEFYSRGVCRFTEREPVQEPFHFGFGATGDSAAEFEAVFFAFDHGLAVVEVGADDDGRLKAQHVQVEEQLEIIENYG